MESSEQKQLNAIREDLASDMLYSRMIIITQYAMKMKNENPNMTPKELDAKIAEFRIQQGWDKPCPDCHRNMIKVMNQNAHLCIHCNKTI